MNDYLIGFIFVLIGMIPAVIYGIFFEGKKKSEPVYIPRPAETPRTVAPRAKDPLPPCTANRRLPYVERCYSRRNPY